MSNNSTFSKKGEYDVIVIGGGATGAGVARDCAYRGLRTLVLERDDLASGTTGRNHGLLHSGARYAVTDHESAVECIEENKILKKIASHCIDDKGGYFLSLPEDGLDFQKEFVEACRVAGIATEIVDPEFAIREEPSMNCDIIGAVKVPDASIDPFRLTVSNMTDAQKHGTEVKTYHKVVGLIVEQGSVIGVKSIDIKTKQQEEFYAQVVVNASGIWGQGIAEYAGLRVRMLPSKGSLVIFGHRVNQKVLNRCRRPSDADILVPGDTITLIGTTSTNIPYDEIDNMVATFDEVQHLISEGAKLAPSLMQTRILRAYSGVRPLVALDDDPSGRSASRGIVLLDHAKRDGLEGFITITGGKLITYRLMAEQAVDLVCKKLGVDVKCTTHEVSLPASRENGTIRKKLISLPPVLAGAAIDRHGSLAVDIFKDTKEQTSLICECEEVTKEELRYAIRELGAKNLSDVRRRTRVGMGTCQGAMCSCRAVNVIEEEKPLNVENAKKEIVRFMNERWKGIRPVGWGEALRESEYTSWIYEDLCGLRS